jgi:hypothetical protein
VGPCRPRDHRVCVFRRPDFEVGPPPSRFNAQQPPKMPLIDPVTMSASVAKSSKGQANTVAPSDSSNAPQSQLQLQPTHTLPTQAAQSARHALPALQAAIFIFRFKSLVADPVSTMWSSLPIVVILQAAYAFVCLPVAGSSRSSRKPRPGEKKKDGGGSNVIVVSRVT